ncbi:MAG TPA: BatA domain-containing protein [Saprospiraceae bacterium]|nr:BatA domain-containing protein [Saprospiraceae bacterium]HPI08626.1 BatA domain-containing protein [Saprospiraceae bacterium]
MQFLFPAFLAALAVLAVPIIVHLFYFRRFKRIYFTNVRFLKEVKEETSNRQKLRNLLVLLMRCLAIIAMVLAFAQPFIPLSSGVKQGERAVSVFVDNSFSMNALSKEAPLLELAKQRARDIISAYDVADRFQVLTNDFEGRDQRLVSKEDALNRIEEIRTGPSSRDLSKVLIRQQQCLNTGKQENKIAFVVSDFQTNIADVTNFKDSLIQVNLVPMRAVQERNVSVDSVWFESPVQVLNQPANLLVKISNRSDEAAEEVRLSLRHDGQAKPVGSLSIPARSTRLDTVSFNILHAGWHEAKLSLTDFPVQFDDDYFISFYVAERINVLSINGIQENKYLNNAFLGVKYFHLDNADLRALDYSKFSNYQLIVLNEPAVISSGLANELKTFVQNGGNVLVFPSPTADLNSYSTFMQGFNAGNLGGFEPVARQASQINTEEFVFRDVFLNKSANLRLPATQGNFKLAPARGEQILTYRDGSAMLAKYPQGEGALFVCAAPLAEQTNDLVRNGEIFVPMLFKMAIAGTKGRQIAYTIGKDEVLEARHQVSASGETIYKLRKDAEDPAAPTSEEFIPEQRIFGSKVLLTPGTQVHDAGWYRLGLQGDSTLAAYAFNFDRKESDLSYKDETALSEGLPGNMKVLSQNAEANFSQVVGEQERGIVLWRWCVIFALLFLALEVLFLRLWKV